MVEGVDERVDDDGDDGDDDDDDDDDLCKKRDSVATPTSSVASKRIAHAILPDPSKNCNRLVRKNDSIHSQQEHLFYGTYTQLCY